MKILKFAAIDIGSNAIRLIIYHVVEDVRGVVFNKNESYRVPLRLGQESFDHQYISKNTTGKLVDCMIAFEKLMKVHEVMDYRACATSAMRDAKNNAEIVAQVLEKSTIRIEIISGQVEADYIYANHLFQSLAIDKAFLYADVGGGSTELTLFHHNIAEASASFKIGTIRLLNDNVHEDTWEEMKKWLKETCKGKKDLEIIGSGGNINQLSKLAASKKKSELSFDVVKDLYQDIKKLSYEERISDMGLKPDRADVIVPAAEIFLNIMRWSDAELINVPKTGMGDGIIRKLYQEYKAK